MNYILIEKEINGMSHRASFRTYNNKPMMKTSIMNKRGTYNRDLETVFFNSKEEGNEKFKSMIAEGYKVISKW